MWKVIKYNKRSEFSVIRYEVYMTVFNMNLIHALCWLCNMSSDEMKDELDKACSMHGK